ncbi:hypothetical protein A3732_16010 [Oleiphilus sp. HI0050]|nr:hypothetical protein A3732_16010 [Oleiphilus sp. HI0050]
MSNIEQNLGELVCLFARGAKTYQSYLNNEKTFLYAKILKDNNERIRSILLKLTSKVPEEMFVCCIDLIHHIDVWMELWLDLSERLDLKLDEPFVFQNKVNYPVEAEKKLTALYEELKENGKAEC